MLWLVKVGALFFYYWCPVKIGLHHVTYIYTPFIQN